MRQTSKSTSPTSKTHRFVGFVSSGQGSQTTSHTNAAFESVDCRGIIARARLQSGNRTFGSGSVRVTLLTGRNTELTKKSNALTTFLRWNEKCSTYEVLVGVEGIMNEKIEVEAVGEINEVVCV
jgi:hypothetical protein